MTAVTRPAARRWNADPRLGPDGPYAGRADDHGQVLAVGWLGVSIAMLALAVTGRILLASPDAQRLLGDAPALRRARDPDKHRRTSDRNPARAEHAVGPAPVPRGAHQAHRDERRGRVVAVRPACADRSGVSMRARPQHRSPAQRRDQPDHRGLCVGNPVPVYHRRVRLEAMGRTTRGRRCRAISPTVRPDPHGARSGRYPDGVELDQFTLDFGS